MVLGRAALLCALVAACDLRPLSSEDLRPRDGAAPAPDGGVSDGRDEPRAPDGRPPADGALQDDVHAMSPSDAATPACAPDSRAGLLSGVVVDACTGAQIEAHVGIAGVHVCSYAAKGSFFIRDLPTGCVLTLTSGRDGYELHDEAISLAAGGTSVRIALRRKGGCAAPAPPAEPGCRCDASPCGG